MPTGNVSLLNRNDTGAGASPLFAGGRTTPVAPPGQGVGAGAGADQGTAQLMQYIQLLKAVNDSKKTQAAAGGGGGGNSGGLLSGMMSGKGGGTPVGDVPIASSGTSGADATAGP